jgi:ABC-type transport system involved in multi-copper enzyme maturation permease subunit
MVNNAWQFGDRRQFTHHESHTMRFLPIVDRELRVAARRRSTFRIRRWTAFLAMLASVFFLLYVWVAGSGDGPGNVLFGLLSTYAVLLCMLAGVFITADCLSQEKREGTLGLLFLTDLKGYDVVLGKFFATSLNSFYGLLAIFPMLALPLLLGGVTGEEFWRTTLALLNALFFSLTIGICISTVSRDPQRAMGGTFGLLVLSAFVWPVMEELCSSFGLSPVWGYFSWFSPVLSFAAARDVVYLAQPEKFWIPLLVSNVFGWGFLTTAALSLPRAWQDAPIGLRKRPWRERVRRWGRGSVAYAKKRARLLETNPVLWLMTDQPAFRWAVWGIVALWSAIVLTFVFFGSGEEIFGLGIYGARGFGFVLKMFIAVQACRFFAEARRNGSLEMLLSTPLNSDEILRGQWLAIHRIFVAPLLVFVVMTFVPTAFSIFKELTLGNFSELPPRFWTFAVHFYYLGVNGTADFFAVGWVGMWLALSMKKHALAGAMTILVALVLPEILLCVPDFILALLLLAWARTRLITDFRKLTLAQYQSNWIAPRPATRVSGAPPRPN